MLNLVNISPDHPSFNPEVTINKSLSKSSPQTINSVNCWDLASFYEDAGHSGDDQFRFKYWVSIGYWHTIIYNLANNWSSNCGGVTYPANLLQDKISSHYWLGEAYSNYPLFLYPRFLEVWEHAYRSGTSKKWGATWIPGVGMVMDDGNYSNDGVNDKVSSIQMTYEVKTR
ncbi:hypothetical protein GF406_04605 [candidate division KSB1 bacterium]|nr:hypothetical protein [candidate division KSB1 bacterium]